MNPLYIPELQSSTTIAPSAESELPPLIPHPLYIPDLQRAALPTPSGAEEAPPQPCKPRKETRTGGGTAEEEAEEASRRSAEAEAEAGGAGCSQPDRSSSQDGSLSPTSKPQREAVLAGSSSANLTIGSIGSSSTKDVPQMKRVASSSSMAARPLSRSTSAAAESRLPSVVTARPGVRMSLGSNSSGSDDLPLHKLAGASPKKQSATTFVAGSRYIPRHPAAPSRTIKDLPRSSPYSSGASSSGGAIPLLAPPTAAAARQQAGPLVTRAIAALSAAATRDSSTSGGGTAAVVVAEGTASRGSVSEGGAAAIVDELHVAAVPESLQQEPLGACSAVKAAIAIPVSSQRELSADVSISIVATDAAEPALLAVEGAEAAPQLKAGSRDAPRSLPEVAANRLPRSSDGGRSSCVPLPPAPLHFDDDADGRESRGRGRFGCGVIPRLTGSFGRRSHSRPRISNFGSEDGGPASETSGQLASGTGVAFRSSDRGARNSSSGGGALSAAGVEIGGGPRRGSAGGGLSAEVSSSSLVGTEVTEVTEEGVEPRVAKKGLGQRISRKLSKLLGGGADK